MAWGRCAMVWLRTVYMLCSASATPPPGVGRRNKKNIGQRIQCDESYIERGVYFFIYFTASNLALRLPQPIAGIDLNPPYKAYNTLAMTLTHTLTMLKNR